MGLHIFTQVGLPAIPRVAASISAGEGAQRRWSGTNKSAASTTLLCKMTAMNRALEEKLRTIVRGARLELVRFKFLDATGENQPRGYPRGPLPT